MNKSARSPGSPRPFPLVVGAGLRLIRVWVGYLSEAYILAFASSILAALNRFRCRTYAVKRREPKRCSMIVSGYQVMWGTKAVRVGLA